MFVHDEPTLITMTPTSHRDGPTESHGGEIEPGADGADELVAVFIELVERSDSILALDRGQRRAWVSGILSAWRSDIVVDDPDATDTAFVDFVRTRGPSIVDRRVAATIEATAHDLLDPGADPPAKITHSWLVTDHRSPGERTNVITVQRDEAEYSILASIVDGVLADLRVSGDVVDLLGDNPSDLATSRVSLEVAPVEASHAVDELVKAWGRLSADAEPGELPESLLTNQLLVRADLVAWGVARDALPLFRSDPDPETTVFFAGCSETEIAEGNRWAFDALTVALRPYSDELAADAELDTTWSDPARLDEIAVVFRGPLTDLSRREREALVYLEWADWVGAIVGIIAASVSAPDTACFDGETIVELINSHPELTSAIEPSDRDYVAYGFDVALAVWADAGLVKAGSFVPGGRSGLVQTAEHVWGR